MATDEQAEADLNENKSEKALLKEMYALGRDMTTQGQRDLRMMQIMGKFSAILIRISAKAERQSQRVIRLTWALIFLTLALFVLAGIEASRHFLGR